MNTAISTGTRVIPDETEDTPSLSRRAYSAVRAGKPAEALAAWTALRARAPGNADAVAGMGQALMGLGRLQDAAALAAAAAADAATAKAAAILRARIAERRRDWATALVEWRAVANMAPTSADAWIGASQALCKLGRPGEADAMLLEAMRASPDDAALVAAYCRVAEMARDWDEAGRRWQEAGSRMPDRPEPACGTARTLLGQGKLEQAEASALSAMRRFPAHADAYVIYARVAMARLDWPEAVQRWTVARQRFPNHPAMAASCKYCERRAAGPSGAVPAVAEAKRDLLAPATDWTLDRSNKALVADFLANFESLGSNCEFGLVQRKFGAEPLGLLRWANMQPHWLVRALAERFEGVGTQDQTRIIMLRNEYGAVDERFKFGLHLRIRPEEAPPERVLVSQGRRLAFLRDKLVAELDGQEKIFVFSCFRITNQELSAISARLSAYGPNILLCVRAASDAHPGGSVEVVSDRLVVGYVAQPALERRTRSWNIPFDDWLRFCETAWRLRTEVQGVNRQDAKAI